MRKLIVHSIGGGWGSDAPSEETERVAVIRGADFPRVSVGDVSGVPIRWESIRKLPSRILKEGDIVLESSGGTSERPTGRTVYISQRLLDQFDVPIIPASFCRLLRIDSERADPQYVYWWLQGMYADGRTWGYQNRSTGIANFQFEHFLDAELVVLPQQEEQREIAATLGALDDKIESNGRVIKLIDEVVRARFDRDFNVEQAANGVAIGDLVSINRRHKLVRGEEATYVGMSSLPEFSPTIIEWERRAFGTGQKFVNGDVLMARITPCLENGKTAVADMLGDGEVGWGSTEYVVLSPRGAFSTPWIYALTRNQTIRDWAISRMTGTSGRQRFQATEFNQYRIQEPDSGVLAAFNDFAVPLFQKMTQARNESRLLQQLRDILLPELLSGRIRTALKGDA